MKFEERNNKAADGTIITVKDVDIAMARTLIHKNCNEPGDFVSKDIRELQDANLVAEFMKFIKQMFPGMGRMVEACICTARVDGRKSYEARTIVLILVLTGVLGIPAVSGVASLNTVQGISNIAFFCEQNGLVEIPNYQTLTNALDSIIDLEGFNNLYADFFDILDLSKRYDSTRPTLVYQGMRGADGEFPLMVSRLTPIIGDGVETARSQSRMSDQDLTYTFRDQEGTIIRTDFAQKKLVMVADMNENVLQPICAEPIENVPGFDYTTVYGEKDTEKRKQACEIKTATEMVNMIHNRFPGRNFLFQGDGLYPTRPFMSTILSNGDAFLFTLKEGCAPVLYRTAMEAMERQRKDYAEGRCKENPVHNVKVGGDDMQVQYVMDVGALTGDPDWADYPANVIKASYCEDFTVCNERSEQKIRTRRGIAEAKAKNEAEPLPDFTEEACKEMFRERYKKSHPKLKDGQIEEILDEAVTFTQSRDPRTLCRIVIAHIVQRFVWVTNIVLDLSAVKTAKQLLMGKLLGNSGSKDYGKSLEARKYISGYIGRIVYQGRRRWCVEELFGMIKGDLFKVGRKKRHKSYKVEKALFYITLLSWFFLEIFRTYNKYAAKGLKRWKLIADRLRASFQNDDVRDEAEYMNRRTCLRPQLE